MNDEEKISITSALTHYLKQDFVKITDFEKVIENRTQISVNGETCYQYECPGQTIYLDSENYAIEYANQHIVKLFYNTKDDLITDNEGIPVDCDDTGDTYIRAEREYYYDFNPNLEGVAGTYEYINTYEWKRNQNIWE